MTISLIPEQQAWINARIERGEFASIEEAVQDRICERELEDIDDMAWAKPLLEEALAEVERGEFINVSEHRARNAARLAALKD
jgi:antitoxin ParD1/3/4